MGSFKGCKARNPELANEVLDRAVEDDVLASYYPLLETAGIIDRHGVTRLMRALDFGKAIPANFQTLAYGRAADPISSQDLKVIILGIAARPDGFDAALEILFMRLDSEKDWKSGYSPETLDAGRQLMGQVLFAGRDQREDFRMGEVVKACFAGPDGAAPVRDLCRKLKSAVSNYCTRPFYHDDLFVGLLSVQPLTCLDALCSGGAADLKRGMRIIDEIRRFRTSLLELIPEAVLLAWCDEEPAARYPAVAGCISISTNADGDKSREWTKLALRLLDKALDRVAVLKAFTPEFGWQGGWGSAVTDLEANTKLLSKLEGHPDASVRAFVAQEQARLAREIERARKIEEAEERHTSGSFE